MSALPPRRRVSLILVKLGSAHGHTRVLRIRLDNSASDAAALGDVTSFPGYYSPIEAAYIVVQEE